MQVCDDVTGQCLCPPLVTGKECDRCMQNAYNYSATDGCMVSDAIMTPCCHCDIMTSLVSVCALPL